MLVQARTPETRNAGGGDLLLTHAPVNEARANRPPNPCQRLELDSQKESERSD
jgi:hypothetical protein